MTPEQFRSARLALDYSTARLAKRIGVASGRTVRRWESGDRPLPGFAIKMCNLLVWFDFNEIPDPEPVARRKRPALSDQP